MRLQPEDDVLASMGGRFRRLTIDVQRRVGHRQGVQLLVHAFRELCRKKHACLRDAAPALKHTLLSGHQFTFDSLRIGPRRRKLVDAAASLVGPREETLYVASAPAQNVLDGRPSRVNLRQPLRIRVEARQVH